jgi:hypothetical protein
MKTFYEFLKQMWSEQGPVQNAPVAGQPQGAQPAAAAPMPPGQQGAQQQQAGGRGVSPAVPPPDKAFNDILTTAAKNTDFVTALMRNAPKVTNPDMKKFLTSFAQSLNNSQQAAKSGGQAQQAQQGQAAPQAGGAGMAGGTPTAGK